MRLREPATVLSMVVVIKLALPKKWLNRPFKERVSRIWDAIAPVIAVGVCAGPRAPVLAHELINAPAVHLAISASDYVVNNAGVPFLQSADAGITGNSITLGVNGSLSISDPAKPNRSRGIPTTAD
jgi:hypothetical protein